MSAWTVVPSLLSLRAEFNAIAPNRDKGADGTIGDTAHTSASDHTPDEDSNVLRDHDADSKNEVHALDIDSSGPWPDGRTFASLVSAVIAGERAKWLSATDRCRLKYVIFNRRIYSQSNDFRGVAYTGSDPHTNHAHFSARYDTPAENDTRPWGVYVPPKPEPVKEWSDMATEAEVRAIVADEINKALNVNRPEYQLTRIADRGWGAVSFKKQLDYIMEALVAGQNYDANEDGAATEASSLQARLTYLEEMLEEVRDLVAQLNAGPA